MASFNYQHNTIKNHLKGIFNDGLPRLGWSVYVIVEYYLDYINQGMKIHLLQWEFSLPRSIDDIGLQSEH